MSQSQSRLRFPNDQFGKHTSGSKPTVERQALMVSQSKSSRET